MIKMMMFIILLLLLIYLDDLLFYCYIEMKCMYILSISIYCIII